MAITPGIDFGAPPRERARALRLHDRRGEARGRRRALARHLARPMTRAARRIRPAVVAVAAGASCGARRAASTRRVLLAGRAGQVDLLARARSRSTKSSQTTPTMPCSRRGSSACRRSAPSRRASSALPDNRSYTRYADLGRPFVVWNVFAAPELSLDAAAVVLSGRRLRQLPRLFREERRARRGRAARRRGRRRPRRRRARVLDARLASTIRCCRRSSASARSSSRASCSTSSRIRSSTSRTTRRSTSRSPSPSRRRGVARWLAAQRDAQPDCAQLARGRRRARQRLRADFRGLVARHARAARGSSTRATRPTRRSAQAKAAVFAAMRAEYERRRPAAGRRRRLRPLVRGRRQQRGHRGRAALHRPGRRSSGRCWPRKAGDLPRFYERVKALAALPKDERDAALARAVRALADDSAAHATQRPAEAIARTGASYRSLAIYRLVLERKSRL